MGRLEREVYKVNQFSILKKKLEKEFDKVDKLRGSYLEVELINGEDEVSFKAINESGDNYNVDVYMKDVSNAVVKILLSSTEQFSGILNVTDSEAVNAQEMFYSVISPVFTRAEILKLNQLLGQKLGFVVDLYSEADFRKKKKDEYFDGHLDVEFEKNYYSFHSDFRGNVGDMARVFKNPTIIISANDSFKNHNILYFALSLRWEYHERGSNGTSLPLLNGNSYFSFDKLSREWLFD